MNDLERQTGFKVSSLYADRSGIQKGVKPKVNRVIIEFTIK